MEHRRTLLAIAVCFVLTIPGFAIGWIVATIYSFILIGWVGGGSLFDYIGLEIVTSIFQVWFPALLQGIVAGVVAMGVTGIILKRANYDVVAYVSSAIVVVPTIYLIAEGQILRLETVTLIAGSVGTIGAYFAIALNIVEETQSVASSVKETQTFISDLDGAELPEKSPPQKSTPQKSTPKKVGTKNSLPNKSTPKKTTPKKSTPKKSTPKKSTPKKST